MTRRLILITGAAVAVAAPAAVAVASTSHAKFWQNKAHTVVCGKRIIVHPYQLLCSAKGNPQARHRQPGWRPVRCLDQEGQAHARAPQPA